MGEANQPWQPERITLRLPGAREANLEPFESPSTRAGVMQVEALSAYRIEAARAGAEAVVIPNVPDAPWSRSSWTAASVCGPALDCCAKTWRRRAHAAEHRASVCSRLHCSSGR